MVEQVGDDIAKELGVRYQHLNEALESAKKELGLSAIASYKALRDMGASVKEAWNKAILLTAENFKISATKLYKKNGGVKPVVVPVVIVAVVFAPEITLLSTVLIGLLIKDKMQESMANSGPRGPKIHSTPLHESGPSTESFPIPNPSDRGDLPPYEAHPDDFAETRGRGGYGAHPEEAGPKIFSTPIIDIDPIDSIFMNENGGADKWSRVPRSLQDEMALKAAKSGSASAERILKETPMDDPRYQGMHKMELRIKSGSGKDSVIHYILNPKTGEVMDFKFKKHSTD